MLILVIIRKLRVERSEPPLSFCALLLRSAYLE